jgi:hypothetical protein
MGRVAWEEERGTLARTKKIAAPDYAPGCDKYCTCRKHVSWDRGNGDSRLRWDRGGNLRLGHTHPTADTAFARTRMRTLKGEHAD